MKNIFFWGGGFEKFSGGGVKKFSWEGLRKIWGGWLIIFVELRKFRGVEKFSGGWGVEKFWGVWGWIEKFSGVG